MVSKQELGDRVIRLRDREMLGLPRQALYRLLKLVVESGGQCGERDCESIASIDLLKLAVSANEDASDLLVYEDSQKEFWLIESANCEPLVEVFQELGESIFSAPWPSSLDLQEMVPDLGAQVVDTGYLLKLIRDGDPHILLLIIESFFRRFCVDSIGREWLGVTLVGTNCISVRSGDWELVLYFHTGKSSASVREVQEAHFITQSRIRDEYFVDPGRIWGVVVASDFSMNASERARFFGITLLPFEALVRILGVIQESNEELPQHFAVWMLFRLAEIAGPFGLPATQIAAAFKRELEEGVGELS